MTEGMPEEMKTYKYLGILDADTIKHTEMKEKINKENTTRERENYWKPKYIA